MEQSDLTNHGKNKEDMAHLDTLELGELPNSDNEGIYDDIEDFDLGKEVDKLKAENAELENQIDKLVAAIIKLRAELTDTIKVQENLKNNISSLYMTAKAEIDRKNRQIADLQRELDDLKFRRKRPANGIQFPPQKRARYGNENDQSDNRGPAPTIDGQRNNFEGRKDHGQRTSTRHEENKGQLLHFNTQKPEDYPERVRNNDEADQRHTREVEDVLNKDQFLKGSKKQGNYEDTRGYREDRYEAQSRKQRSATQNDHDSEDKKSDDINRITELENRLGRGRGGTNWHDDPQEEREYRRRKYEEFNNERRGRNRHDQDRLGRRYQREQDIHGERHYRDGRGRERERRRDRNSRRDSSRERGYNNDRDRRRSRDRPSRSVRSSSRESHQKNRTDPKGEASIDEMIEKLPEKTSAKQEDNCFQVQVTKIVSRKKLKVVQKLEESMGRSPHKKLNTASNISTDRQTNAKNMTPDEKKILQKQWSDKTILVLSNIVLSDSSDQKGEVSSEEKPSATERSKEAEDSDDLSQIQNHLCVEGISFPDKKKNEVSNKCTTETTAATDSESNSIQVDPKSTPTNADTRNKRKSSKKITLDAYKDRNQNSKCGENHVEEKAGKNDSIQNFPSLEESGFCDKNKNKVSTSVPTETPVATDLESNLLPVDPKSTDGEMKNKTDSSNKITLDEHKDKNQNPKCEKKHIEEKAGKNNDSTQNFSDKDENKVSNSRTTETPVEESNSLQVDSKLADHDSKNKTDRSKKLTLDVHKDKNQNSKCGKKHKEEKVGKNNSTQKGLNFCVKDGKKVSNCSAAETPNLLQCTPKSTATDGDRKDKTDTLKEITLDAYKDRNQVSKCEKKHVEEKTGKNMDMNKVLKTKEDLQRDLEADGLIFRNKSTHSTTGVKEIDVISETKCTMKEAVKNNLKITQTEAEPVEVSEANENINRKEATTALLFLGMKEGIQTTTGLLSEGKSSSSNLENNIFGTGTVQNDVIYSKVSKEKDSLVSKTSKKYAVVIEKQEASNLQRKADTRKMNEANIEAEDRKKTSENIKDGKSKTKNIGETVVNGLCENLDIDRKNIVKGKQAASNSGAKSKDMSNSTTSDDKTNPRKEDTGKQLVKNDLRAKIKNLFDESMDTSEVNTNAPETNVDTDKASLTTKTNKSNARKTSEVKEIKNGKCKGADNETCQKNSSDLVKKEDKKEVTKVRSSPRNRKIAEKKLPSISSQKRSRSKSTSNKSDSDQEAKKQKIKKLDDEDKCGIRKNDKDKSCTGTLKASFDKLNKQIDALTDTQKVSEALADEERQSNGNIKADTKQKVLKNDENLVKNVNTKQEDLCSVDHPIENVVIAKNNRQTNLPAKVVEEKSSASERKASFGCLNNAPGNSEVPKVSAAENTPENKKIITRKRITPTPVTDTKKQATFGDMLKKCDASVAGKAVKNLMIEQSLHLTHEGDIPLLHIEENHIDSLPNEDLRNPDSSLMRLIDTMTLSNMECDLTKAHDGNQGKEQELVARTELTFENLMYKVSSSPVHVTSAKSTESNDICSVGDAISTQQDGNSNTNVSSTPKNGTVTNASGSIAKTSVKRKRRLVRLIISD